MAELLGNQANDLLPSQEALPKFNRFMGKYTFIDKTKFAEYFFKLGSPHVVLAPLGFGKTQNLRMLDLFFRIPMDENGTEVTTLIEEKRKVFGTLKICKENKVFCDENMSKYPVMHISFAHFTVEYSIVEQFQDHDYLTHSSLLSAEEKKLIDKYIHIASSPMPPEDIARGGLVLSELLYKHHNQKCIILIDDYDQFASDALWVMDADVSMNKTFKIVAKFLTYLLKDNKFVGHTLLTGTTRVGDVYMQEFKKLTYISVFDNPQISKHFGFSEDDIEHLFSNLGEIGKLTNLQDVKNIIPGYDVVGGKQTSFSPAAIDAYHATMSLNEVRTSYHEISDIHPLYEYNLLGGLMEKSIEEGITITRKDRIGDGDYRFLQRLTRSQKGTDFTGKESVDLLFQYLQELGYYRVTKKLAGGKLALTVLNRKAKRGIQEVLYNELKFFTDKYGVSKHDYDLFIKSLCAIGKTEKSFYELMSFVVRFAKSPNMRQEYDLRVLLSKLFDLVSYEANFVRDPSDSKVKQADGTIEYVDLVVYRRDGTRLIFDIKFQESSVVSSYEALKEILSRKYYNCKHYSKDYVVFNDVLIGFSLFKDRKCHISYLYNSKNIADAKNVTLPATESR